MDCEKVGKIIRKLRLEKQFTQQSLAERLHLSDRTISKWECGLGCPDVSLLPELSRQLGADIHQLLEGDLSPNSTDRGNMKRIKFYRCPLCGNIMTMTGEAKVSCCGRQLSSMEIQAADAQHALHIELVEDEYYITFAHPMTKDHYISFFACVGCDRILLVRLYPEQGSEVRIPRLAGRPDFYIGCNQHGLWKSC